LAEKDRQKTVFVCKSGLYKFNVMPMGLSNSPATFQRTMDTLFRKFLWQFLIIYMDDLILHAKNNFAHLKQFALVFATLSAFGLKVNLKKCQFFQSNLKYLGYIVSASGVQVDSAKVSAIANMAAPHDISQLRSFIGGMNYYRKFIPKLASIAARSLDF
jgi:hypothetical protein